MAAHRAKLRAGYRMTTAASSQAITSSTVSFTKELKCGERDHPLAARVKPIGSRSWFPLHYPGSGQRLECVLPDILVPGRSICITSDKTSTLI
jgi:hypothetical protein